MDTRLAVGGAVGTLATVVAALALFAPDVLTAVPALPALVEWAETVDAGAALLVAGLLVALAAIVAARIGVQGTSDGVATDAFDGLTGTPPEAATASHRTVTGAGLDGAIDSAVDGDDDALGTVRTRLATLAAAAHARTAGDDRDAADAAVRTGDWTEDPVAAAFLAEDGAARQSIAARLRLWLAPERERRRRVDRTLAAIDSTLEGGQ